MPVGIQYVLLNILRVPFNSEGLLFHGFLTSLGYTPKHKKGLIEDFACLNTCELSNFE